MTTIRDVAKHAGVAPITVSRVINDAKYISDETRARVLASVEALAYVPNRLAGSLRSRQTNLVALILTDITNPFWTNVARGVEDAASDAGFNLIVCNTDESKTEEDNYVRLLLERQVDGMLLVPAWTSVDSVQFVHKQNVPVVILDRRLPEQIADVVRCDSEGGAYQLARLLLSLHHRRFAVLSGPLLISTAEDRVAGFLRATRQEGLPDEDSIVLYGEYTIRGGYEMTRQALYEKPDITAIFAANNFIAAGAFTCLQEHGLRVPEDISLVCFDDIPFTPIYEPFLTVASQPSYDMGRRAMQVLLGRLSGDISESYQDIVLPVELIVRKSSGEQAAKA